MTISILLLVGMVVLFAAGISLLLERSLTRMVLGFLLVGNATNLLVFFMSGSYGAAPIYNPDLEANDYSDPLPQAFILTAIVITLGVSAFLLALIYRSWRLAQDDTVEDDQEDIAMRTLDPSLDDETFDEEDAGDTEFGVSAEAAVSTAAADPDELDEPELVGEHGRTELAGDTHAGRADDTGGNESGDRRGPETTRPGDEGGERP